MKVLERYGVDADKVPASVKIIEDNEHNVPIYDISTPQIGPATLALMESLKSKVSELVPIEIEESIDPEKSKQQKEHFLKQIKGVIQDNLPDESEDRIDILAGVMLHQMFGLGFIELLMSDDNLEELAINGVKQPISIYHKKHGWCRTNYSLQHEDEIFNLSSQIGRKVGREINSLHPIMDAHLLTGDRVESTLFPITTVGNTITIRRFSRNPWTIIHLIEANTISSEVAAFLWQAIQYELNILVAGGTASGKTSMLSALCSLMPPTQRILSIEDTREISLPDNLQWNWVPMTTRNKNPEGEGEVTMLDLMVASLRMRPDRIIVGEVRRKEQAETMFEAMHTGHSVYTTIHADTAEQVRRRLTEPPIDIPKTEVESLHLTLVQFRDRRIGKRRTLELAEVLSGSDELELNYLYRWHPRTDKFEKANSSVRVTEALNLHTGMTAKEIERQRADKQKVLEWMREKGLKDMDQVGRVMSVYYKDPSKVMDAVKKNRKQI